MSERRNVADFVTWLASGQITPAALTIVQTVTGVDMSVEPVAPTEPYDFASCVLLVETHGLYDQLCEIAVLSAPWWRVIANWGRLVRALDTEPWRDGEPSEALEAQAILDALNLRTQRAKTVLLDMDIPLADLNRHVFDHGQPLGWFDIETYEENRDMLLASHCPDPDHKQAIRDMVESAGFFRALPVVEGAQDGVEALLTAGHTIWVATKPLKASPTCRDEKQAWLTEHFPMLEDRMITIPDKSVLIGDLLLDDAINHEQATRAVWEPVVFRSTFNGAGSEWGCYPNWGWGDPVGRLGS